jgi:hypothetical protein
MAERKYVDLEDDPDLPTLVRDLHSSREPIVLREAGEEVATLTPSGPRPVSEADVAAFLALAGSLAGTFPDDFVEQNYRQRLVGTRPPYEP